MQNPAEVIDGGGVQGFILAQFVNGGAGNVVVFDEGVGRFPGFFQGLPEGGVVDHGIISWDSITFYPRIYFSS